MNSLCIIPARGGSKRIPRKNIRPFLGKPIIAYSIEAALVSGLFDKIIVSTDDADIAQVAKSYGASVPYLRSARNASDTATTVDVLREVHLDMHERATQQACCVYATAPFVTAELLHRAYKLFSDGSYDSVFPVIAYGAPLQRALHRDTDGKTYMLYPEHQQTRTQDLEPRYYDCGMFYWYRPEAILQQGKLWTDHSATIVVDELHAQDIDRPEDWTLAELKYQRLRP